MDFRQRLEADLLQLKADLLLLLVLEADLLLLLLLLLEADPSNHLLRRVLLFRRRLACAKHTVIKYGPDRSIVPITDG